MAAGGPAGALSDKRSVVDLANEHASRCSLDLSVAFQAEIHIALDEQFVVYGSVRVMTNDAAFAHRFVLEYKWTGLFAMAPGAGFIELRHRQAAGGFHDVRPVWIVALGAVHVPFDDRMMMGQAEFRVGAHMTAEARLRFLAGIEDELVPPLSAGLYVATGRSMARFATVLLCLARGTHEHPGMRAAVEFLGDRRMAVHAGLIAHEMRALDVQRLDHRPRDTGAGTEDGQPGPQGSEGDQRGQPVSLLHGQNVR